MQPICEKVVRRKKRRRGLFLWRTAVCLCLLFLLVAVAKGTTAVVADLSGSRPAFSSQSDSSARPASAARQTAAAESFAPGASSRAPVSSRAPAADSSSPENAPSPESGPPGRQAARGWFSDALFIGDSRTEGLRNYGGLSGATYYALKGLMVNTVYTRREIMENGSKKTVMEAQAEHPFGKIYVMLGVNELGWSSMQSFVDDYSKMVKDLKKDHPKAEIYLQAIFPVSAQKSAESSIYKNSKIVSYNQAIQKIAKDQKVSYLDTARAVSENGVLPEDASTDGVHLNSEYCAKWCDYLKANE
ncbi:GDSL-like Lipase/Acylhydrolase family protein [Caprobacter fermentans]|uniref:GDSL-like Lipase/Acylhydrolase family protein n=1 Tax=Caproicibacter fermentans TaxID=2576756 RepID=A0A6N8I074_9FIRM|nr:GDSL-type esterase/lipase family protein [Caproicibacter fermentans]MVB10963.1 GDSL-like Lipase/Acylhydrolase family protein [Caproicibacter fermentans]